MSLPGVGGAKRQWAMIMTRKTTIILVVNNNSQQGWHGDLGRWGKRRQRFAGLVGTDCRSIYHLTADGTKKENKEESFDPAGKSMRGH